MQDIFALTFIDILLIFISLYKKDSNLLFLTGILTTVTGIEIFRTGFGSLLTSSAIGFIISFLGIYIITRTGIDMLTMKKKGGIDNERRKKDIRPKS